MSDRLRNIVVLTGSGISAESGVATFRDKNGVWAKYDYRDVASPEGFAANPSLVHEFYNSRRRGLKSVEPNAAHFALARLEAEIANRDGRLLLVTQNVDDLHERAGSSNILHMHGELLKARCVNCESIHAWADDMDVDAKCVCCGQTGGMRPDIVWFGEIPKFMDEICDAVAAADLFVSIGTSGSVYPAAGFSALARDAGVRCAELNLEPSENAHIFDETRYGAATKIVPAWAEELLS